MRKICIINQKGGVGKTTTTANIAHGLADMGKRVLAIDLDPQGNLSKFFNITQERKDIYSILIENADVQECIHEITPQLHFISSRETLTKAELIMSGEPGREGIMARRLAGLTQYDYILIDCAPSLGLLNQNGMLFASEAFIPVSTDYLGMEALQKILSAIHTINDVFGHSLRITKVIPTMYDARLKHCRESLAHIQNEFYEASTDPIRVNSKLKELPKHQASIFTFDKRSNGAQDYKKLINHIVQQEDEFEQADVDIPQGGMVVTMF
ncbi:MAG: ParA family protein [Candidatus Woesearchaeota archaeon]